MKNWDKFKIMQEALPLLGTMTDGEVAKKLGVPRTTIATWRRENGIPNHYKRIELRPEVLSLLGTMVDRKLAKKLGISFSTARKWRERAGIPRWHLQQKAAALPLLGTMKDNELAKKLEVSRVSIAKWRKEAGIPRYLVPAVVKVTHQTLKARIKELEEEVARLQNLNKEKAQ